jgi:hypothetical protein
MSQNGTCRAQSETLGRIMDDMAEMRQQQMKTPRACGAEWQIVLQRLDNYAVKNNVSDEVSKCMRLLGKYDYYGGPCDWQPRLEKEKVIHGWADWIVLHEERYKKQLKVCAAQYEKGHIPDCWDMMMDYFN